MYSEHHYLSRSTLAKELAQLPENIRQRKAYLEIADRWRKLADSVNADIKRKAGR
jgi:hypothetical protein